MNPELIYNGTVDDNGKLTIHRRKEMADDVKNLFSGKQVVITIKRKRKTRSVLQNAYYWSVVVPLVKQGMIDTGFKVSVEHCHLLLKTKFNLKEIVNESTGEIIKIIGSTTEMSTSEMMDYFAEIKQWAAEYLNVQIPDPGEQLNIKFT